MVKNYLLILPFCVAFQIVTAQTFLTADGPGNTYELINSVLAPGHNAVEAPDCKHSSFGRHIEEVFDNALNKYVFKFHIHTHEDDDRCINFDRQRNEIKTYDKSPDNLKAVFQEVVRYKWKFKLDAAFQPSAKFTHIHQIKAVGGSESSMPQITLTPREASPNKMQLRYAQNSSQTTIHETDLAPFLGVWVEATETILYDEIGQGRYELSIKEVTTGNTIFYFNDNSIRMWKTDADFQRPKWGIYRSLDDSISLRDEAVLFADFVIEELDNFTLVSSNTIVENIEIIVFPNPATDRLFFSEDIYQNFETINIFNESGQLVSTKEITTDHISTTDLSSGTYLIEFKTVDIRTKPIRILIK
ncbi:MAG: T9SS type A sorting domain-containing protein [Saprospiraceae bacterium]